MAVHEQRGNFEVCQSEVNNVTTCMQYRIIHLDTFILSLIRSLKGGKGP